MTEHRPARASNDRSTAPSTADARSASVRLVLFDLDGTLIDTAPDLAAAVNRMLVDLGRQPVSEAQVRLWVGDGARVLVQRALGGGGRDAEDCGVERALALFREFYGEGLCVHSRAYPGVRQTLADLRRRGLALACVTNKPEAFTHPLLKALGLHAYFDAIVGGDSLAVKKPSPEPLLLACDTAGVPPRDSVLVGDSANDVRAANAAGMRVICVSYGYNREENLAAIGADAVVESLADAAVIIEQSR